jgi:hypothetical protein
MVQETVTIIPVIGGIIVYFAGMGLSYLLLSLLTPHDKDLWEECGKEYSHETGFLPYYMITWFLSMWILVPVTIKWRLDDFRERWAEEREFKQKLKRNEALRLDKLAEAEAKRQRKEIEMGMKELDKFLGQESRSPPGGQR